MRKGKKPQIETKERNTTYRIQSERGAEQATSWCISGTDKLVSAEDRRQHYGNGWLVASLADCKQDLDKAYSLWLGPWSLASSWCCVELQYSHGRPLSIYLVPLPTCPNSNRE